MTSMLAQELAYYDCFKHNIKHLLSTRCTEVDVPFPAPVQAKCFVCDLKLKDGSTVHLQIYEEATLEFNSTCDQCRIIGWGIHPVSAYRYHFIIPAEVGPDSLDDPTSLVHIAALRYKKKPLPEGFSSIGMPNQSTGDAGSPYNAATSLFDSSSHRLHGVIHANGFGHLLRLNGREGGSKSLSGRTIMDLWDEFCQGLRAKKITVEDVSNKSSMELRVLETSANLRTWYGQWGYHFGRSPFNINENEWTKAYEAIHGAKLRDLLHDAIGLDPALVDIIKRYRLPMGPEPVRVSTLGVLLIRMLWFVSHPEDGMPFFDERVISIAEAEWEAVERVESAKRAETIAVKNYNKQGTAKNKQLMNAAIKELKEAEAEKRIAEKNLAAAKSGKPVVPKGLGPSAAGKPALKVKLKVPPLAAAAASAAAQQNKQQQQQPMSPKPSSPLKTVKAAGTKRGAPEPIEKTIKPEVDANVAKRQRLASPPITMPKQEEEEEGPVDDYSDYLDELADYGPEVVGRKVSVYWKVERQHYIGRISGYNQKSGLHTIDYTGSKAHHDLAATRFTFIDGDDAAVAADGGDDVSSKPGIKKKTQTPTPTPAATVKKKQQSPAKAAEKTPPVPTQKPSPVVVAASSVKLVFPPAPARDDPVERSRLLCRVLRSLLPQSKEVLTEMKTKSDIEKGFSALGGRDCPKPAYGMYWPEYIKGLLDWAQKVIQPGSTGELASSVVVNVTGGDLGIDTDRLHQLGLYPESWKPPLTSTAIKKANAAAVKEAEEQKAVNGGVVHHHASTRTSARLHPSSAGVDGNVPAAASIAAAAATKNNTKKSATPSSPTKKQQQAIKAAAENVLPLSTIKLPPTMDPPHEFSLPPFTQSHWTLEKFMTATRTMLAILKQHPNQWVYRGFIKETTLSKGIKDTGLIDSIYKLLDNALLDGWVMYKGQHSGTKKLYYLARQIGAEVETQVADPGRAIPSSNKRGSKTPPVGGELVTKTPIVAGAVTSTTPAAGMSTQQRQQPRTSVRLRVQTNTATPNTAAPNTSNSNPSNTGEKKKSGGLAVAAVGRDRLTHPPTEAQRRAAEEAVAAATAPPPPPKFTAAAQRASLDGNNNHPSTLGALAASPSAIPRPLVPLTAGVVGPMSPLQLPSRPLTLPPISPGAIMGNGSPIPPALQRLYASSPLATGFPAHLAQGFPMRPPSGAANGVGLVRGPLVNGNNGGMMMMNAMMRPPVALPVLPAPYGEPWRALSPGQPLNERLCKDVRFIRYQVFRDLVHLFVSTLRTYSPLVALNACINTANALQERTITRNLRLHQPLMEASQILRDAKHFLKDCSGERYTDPPHVPAGKIRVLIKLELPASLKELPGTSSTRFGRKFLPVEPPAELLILDSNATLGTLLKGATELYRSIYSMLETFEAGYIVSGLLKVGSANTSSKSKASSSTASLTTATVSPYDINAPLQPLLSKAAIDPTQTPPTVIVAGLAVDLANTWKHHAGGPEDWIVSCTCGTRDDDGEAMVECDVCNMWYHNRCMDVDDDVHGYTCPGCIKRLKTQV